MKFEIKKIKKFSNYLFLAIVKHAFLVSLILFLLALIFGGYLFYKYIILVQKIDIGVLEKPFLLNEKNYQDVLKTWQEQEKRFKETDFKEYPNPFKPLVQKLTE